MWRHVILMVMCGLWYGLGCLSCDHCSGLPVMSSTCLHLYRAKDILTVRCLLLREKWHKSCPDKKCSAWVVIERVVKEMHGLPHPSLLLMYPCATQARGWCGSDTVELYLSLVCVVGLLLCFLWAPWTATCWKTCSCSREGDLSATCQCSSSCLIAKCASSSPCQMWSRLLTHCCSCASKLRLKVQIWTCFNCLLRWEWTKA